MLVFAVMGMSSAGSGAILYRQGWNALNLCALPFLVVTGAAVIWLAYQRRVRAAAAVPLPSAMD